MTPITPEATCSVFARITFSWLSPLLRRGATKPLVQSDLYRIQSVNSADTLLHAYDTASDEEKEPQNGVHSLAWRMWRTVARAPLTRSVPPMLLFVACQVAQPLLHMKSRGADPSICASIAMQCFAPLCSLWWRRLPRPPAVCVCARHVRVPLREHQGVEVPGHCCLSLLLRVCVCCAVCVCVLCVSACRCRMCALVCVCCMCVWGRAACSAQSRPSEILLIRRGTVRQPQLCVCLCVG